MTLDELVLEWSYLTPKGYPDMGNPSDVLILEELLEKLNLPSKDIIKELKEQKSWADKDGKPGVDGMEGSPVEKAIKDKSNPPPSRFTKEDLIDLINSTEISGQEAEKLASTISDLYLTTPITSYLEVKALESNIPSDQIDKFKKLLKYLGIQEDFVNYIKDPVDLDINVKNFTDSIPSIPADKLKILFRKMPTTIVGNVSIGPGEILFSILFKNVRKRDSKGDLDIGDKNVEVKASIGAASKAEEEKGGDAGAVVAKGYGRGAWSSTRKTGKFDDFVGNLGMSEENTQDALKILVASLKWPIKIATIYDIFTKDENFNREIFIRGFEDVLKRIYHKSSFVPKGAYFDLDSYFNEHDFDSKEFEIGIARELVSAYKEHEGFSGMLYLNRQGDMKYFDSMDVLKNIGTDIMIKSFSDDVPRLLFPGHPA